jgi:hypothetical protein
MSLLAFALQVLPVFGLALGATILGNVLLAVYVTRPWQLPLFLLGALLFVALLTFRKIRTWNLVLLGTLALVAGALTGVAFPDGGGAWGAVLSMTCALLILALLLGTYLSGKLSRGLRMLYLLTWFYLAGWLLILIWDPALWLRVLWVIAGVIIFTGLAVVWFSEWEGKETPVGVLAVPEGCELYILALNIAIALRVLLAFLPIG